MLKKVLLVSAGAVLVFALIFGRSGFSYVKTSIADLRQTVNDSVPLDLKIKNARDEIKKIEPEIHDMMRRIAKEELEVEKLRGEVSTRESGLAEAYTHIMVLKNHLQSDELVFVHAKKSYTNEQVETDLARRFKSYQTEENTVEHLREILAAREASLDAAKQQLEETDALRQELLVKIENLEAQARMVKVAQTASDLNFDDSRISRLQEMLNDIESRIAVEKTVTNAKEAGNYGEIPLGEETPADDIAAEIDSYFGSSAKDVAHSNN